jgi:hypothetical protein
MRDRLVLSVGILISLLLPTAGRLAAATDDWPPITAEEKAMKDCPQQPGAPAVFLYREEITDHNTWTATYYCRLKILTAAGKEHANIEIPFVKGSTKIEEYHVKVAETLQEACKLLEIGFEYVTDLNGAKLFRKRK